MWRLLVLLLAVGVATASKDQAELFYQKLVTMEKDVELINRQLLMQQFYVEEQSRSSGDSGLKRKRIRSQGTRPYHSASHADSDTVADIHDHPNEPRTVGLGEIVAVLNGIEFRTGHNDYKLRSRHPTDKRHGTFADIPFPDVPIRVSRLPTVAAQVKEMQQFFKLFKDDFKRQHRRYEKNFQPVICYLEGMWTKGKENDGLKRNFPQESHQLDASNWRELSDKARYASYTGAHDGEENLAYLPTSVLKLQNDNTTGRVQWDYGIYCHPFTYMPNWYMRVVDDIKSRMAMGGLTMEEYAETRMARYQMPILKPSDRDRKFRESVGRTAGWLDYLMRWVPGPDNYAGSINDTLFNQTVHMFSGKSRAPLNVARYHRWFGLRTAGALGRKQRHRGLTDESVFMAQTTDPNVAGLDVKLCKKIGRGKDQHSVCNTWFQKWVYAVPLEIIYMTPLTKWNPYNITDHGSYLSPRGRQVDADGRDGQTPETAFRGVNDRHYYLTPKEFFSDMGEANPSSGTGTATYWVEDQAGVPHEMVASGHRTLTPDIPGCGKVRQRYPIMPIHGHGSGVSKELAALEDMILNSYKYRHMFPAEDVAQCSPGCDAD